MKLLNRSIAGLGLTLTLSAPARAQAVTLKDLTGTWIGSFHNRDINGKDQVLYISNQLLIIRPDSTGLWTPMGNRKLLEAGKMESEFKRIRLIGDTVFSLGLDSVGYKVTLKDQQLTLSSMRKQVNPKANSPDNY